MDEGLSPGIPGVRVDTPTLTPTTVCKRKGRPRKEPQVTVENDTNTLKKRRGRKTKSQFYSSSIRKKMPLGMLSKSTDAAILHFDNNVTEGPETSILESVGGTVTSRRIQESSKETQVVPRNKDSSNLRFEVQTINWSDSVTTDDDDSARTPGAVTGSDDAQHTIAYNPDIWCHHCAHPITDVHPFALGMPFGMSDDSFKIKGYFCSFNCIIAYNHGSSPLISLMYRRLTGGSVSGLKAALPPSQLKEFGGTLSIEDYRQLTNEKTKKIAKMIVYPVVRIE